MTGWDDGEGPVPLVARRRESPTTAGPGPVPAAPGPDRGAGEFEPVGEPVVLGERTYNGQTTRKVLTWVRYNGRGPYLDVRVHSQSESYTGPTKKGLTLTPDELQRLAALVPELLGMVGGGGRPPVPRA